MKEQWCLMSKKDGKKKIHAPTITGRPNIDEISKRNEEAARQERRSSLYGSGNNSALDNRLLCFSYIF